MSTVFLALLYAVAVRAFLFEIKFSDIRAKLSEKHRLIDKFLSCPFCNGFWTGFVTYLLIVWKPEALSDLTLTSLTHLVYFSVTSGFLGWMQSKNTSWN